MTLSDENETNLEVILTEYDTSVELLYSWIKYISESDSFRNFNTVIELNWIELNNHTIVCFWISIMFKKSIILLFSCVLLWSCFKTITRCITYSMHYTCDLMNFLKRENNEDEAH